MDEINDFNSNLTKVYSKNSNIYLVSILYFIIYKMYIIFIEFNSFLKEIVFYLLLFDTYQLPTQHFFQVFGFYILIHPLQLSIIFILGNCLYFIHKFFNLIIRNYN